MVSSKTLLSLGALALSTFTSQTTAFPSSSMKSFVEKRVAAGAAKAILDLLTVIGVFTEDTSINAWDFKALPDMCEVYMETKNGGNCWAVVDCQEGGRIEYNNNHDLWEHCYVQGRQFFNDPRIGEFSIIFTQRDGTEGEGLTNPVLHVANVENWKEWDISGLARAKDQAELCEAGIAPIDCHDGPWICEWSEGGNTPIQNDRTKRWRCGVPKIGASFPEDLTWESVLSRD